jgi:hypothetical protein
MRPFEGIRVIDVTHVLAGPFATYQLAVNSRRCMVRLPPAACVGIIGGPRCGARVVCTQRLAVVFSAM